MTSRRRKAKPDAGSGTVPRAVVTRQARIAAVLAAAAASVALVAVYVVTFLFAGPPSVSAATSGNAASASLTLQTVASLGTPPHASWVSYLARDANGKWHHSTIFNVPAHALIHVTIENFDGASGLRNPFFGLPRGLDGPLTVDGKQIAALNPDLTSHTFAIPDYGVSVPIEGVADNAPHQCSVAPCGPNLAHRTITFTFRTGAPGTVRWQCFVPCAAGWLYGFGGPMQTFGYMDGYFHVT
jgi:hypothetical protein